MSTTEEREFAVEVPEADLNLEPNEPKRSFLDILYGIIFSPRQTMKTVGRQKPLGPSVALLLGVNLLTIVLLFFSFNDNQTFPNILPQAGIPLEAAKKFLYVSSIGLFFIRLIYLFAITACYNLLGELLGGKGNAIGLLSALCLTSIPEIFSVPLLFLGRLLPLGSTLNTLGNFLLWLWSLVLSILALREVLELSTGKALLVFFLPLLVFLTIIVSMVVMSISMLMPLIR